MSKVRGERWWKAGRRRRWLLLAAVSVGTPALLASAAPEAPPVAGMQAEAAAPKTPPQEAPLANRLSGAASPYLRSAAAQPVSWQPWGEAAFRLARKLDRPIWLDVGAIWCHWCHVMDRESYESSEVAAVLNRYFVPVKVDRDERPDIDKRYQLAFQALNGRPGGWPLTMLLTPDGVPFAGATYLPPHARDGSSGIVELGPRVSALYHDQRGQIAEVATRVRAALTRYQAGADAAGTLNPGLPRRVAEAVGGEYDPEYGGFGKGEGSRSPTPQAVRLSLAEGFLEGDSTLTRAALGTLDAYARSGMRDYVHGGFFRYSVDRKLTVPHFEKMDYVQAGLLRAYLDAYRLTGEDRYAATARDIIKYIRNTLVDTAEGGFYAHQDADISLDDDGSYYTWSVNQVEAVLPAPEATVVRLYYGIETPGEMDTDSLQNVLRVVRPVAEVARDAGIPEEVARRRIEDGTRRLEAARRSRRPPLVEQTKFTDRNGMLIAAFLDAYETLGEVEACDFALRAVDFLLAHAVAPDGSVRHVAARAGSAGGDGSRDDAGGDGAAGGGAAAGDAVGEGSGGLLGDYAGLGVALLRAYEVTTRPEYLRAAERVMGRAVNLLWDEDGGGFFDRPETAPAEALLSTRTREFADTALPGENAVAVQALNGLYLLTGEDRWRELAHKTLAAFAGAAATGGSYAATFALAAEAVLRAPPHVVVIGGAMDPRTAHLTRAARATYRPGRLVVAYDPATVDLGSLPEAVAAAARLFQADPTPRAYVCVAETCAPPATAPPRVEQLVRDFGRATGSG